MAISLKLRNLLYIIHAVDPERLRPLLPASIELDLRDTPHGPRAFLATVALEAGAAFPYILSSFRQVNYRVFVRRERVPGVLFLRSWVSARAAAAVMSLAIPTEHASLEIVIEDGAQPYSRYQVRGHSGDYHLSIDARADASAHSPLFPSQDEAVQFLTHRLTGFAAGAHPKGGLSIIRVSHPPMQPVLARVSAASADQWTSTGILTAEEVAQPVLALIQPEVDFDMNLPERLN